MTKREFIDRLRQHLSGLPREDIENSISYYSEMIDDRMEDGLSEEEAVKAVGSVSQIAQQILLDTPLSTLVKAKAKPRRSLKGWEITLLILGAPLWLSLLLAAAATVFALYMTLWALILSLFAVNLSFGVGGLAGIAACIFFLFQMHPLSGLFLLGAGLVLLGMAILCFFLCKAAVHYTVAGSRLALRSVKSYVIRKETC